MSTNSSLWGTCGGSISKWWSWWRHQMETFSALLAICAGNSPVPVQWPGALMFSLICAQINGWVNNGEAGGLRRHRVHYDVIVMCVYYVGVTNLQCFSHDLIMPPKLWPVISKLMCMLDGWNIVPCQLHLDQCVRLFMTVYQVLNLLSMHSGSKSLYKTNTQRLADILLT